MRLFTGLRIFLSITAACILFATAGCRRDQQTSKQEAVARALKWLQNHQEPDGRWAGEVYEGPQVTDKVLIFGLNARLVDREEYNEMIRKLLLEQEKCRAQPPNSPE